MQSIFSALPAGRRVRAFAPLWQTAFFAAKLQLIFLNNMQKAKTNAGCCARVPQANPKIKVTFSN
jgi:hypothetical protein